VSPVLNTGQTLGIEAMPTLLPPDAFENDSSLECYPIYQALIKDWNGFGDYHQKLMNDLRTLFRIALFSSLPSTTTHRGSSDVFCGGHVEVEDMTIFFDAWKQAITTNAAALGIKGGERISSHQSDSKQYEIELPYGWGTLLFGTRKGGTWFQNEAYAITTSKSAWVGHAGTTVQYGSSVGAHYFFGGQASNIGAKGRSKNNDANALTVSAKLGKSLARDGFQTVR
jgi:hypothetical protein